MVATSISRRLLVRLSVIEITVIVLLLSQFLYFTDLNRQIYCVYKLYPETLQQPDVDYLHNFEFIPKYGNAMQEK
jgi:hypothetical protein